jgi:serine/threonine-protein kinase
MVRARIEPMSWALSSGDVLAHYRVISPLGSGGMGQVYLAEDVRLGRRLALKILAPRAIRDEERLHRFEREARSVSALNHPNILTIYDIGHAGGLQFLATEFIDGVTLRTMLAGGRLDARQAVDIAVQVAQALSAAHDAGVIHRDLKPENVMVRSDGYVKVLDFGLAKLTADAAAALDSDADTHLVQTRDGVVMGTFTYMAPEQARGADLDARVDLFALGILLYEMLQGEPPFKGATAADVVGAVLFRDPHPLSADVLVPDGLYHVLARALRKDRAERYQSSAQMLQDLRAISRALDSAGPLERSGAAALRGDALETRAAPAFAAAADEVATPAPSGKSARRRRARRTVDSVAVLPLVNETRDRDLDYLSDGLTESLINNLSQLPKLRVMARSTVFRYKGRDADPREVGRTLDVQAVLTGRVAERGQALTVSVELVDVDDGSQLWGTSLTRAVSDVFALQAEISGELTGALRLRLTRDERRRLAKRHTVNAEAYQLYLRGRYFLNSRTGDALRSARALFEHAVAEDPNYALAYAGLADCCSLIAVSLRTSAVPRLIEEARAAALRAHALDPDLAEAHASLAFIGFRFDWNWPEAEAGFTRALALNPGHAPSRQWHAMFLASRSRFDEALQEMKRALELDPLSLIIQSGIGRVLHFAGRLDEAVTQFENVLQTNSGFGQARIDLALTRMARGEIAAARAELADARERLGDVSTILLLQVCCAARDGRLAEARGVFEELQKRYGQGTAGADDLALAAAALEEWPAARGWLAQACAHRAPFLGYVDVEPAMRPLLRDAACRELLRAHGFDARLPRTEP